MAQQCVALFPLGRICATPGALAAMEEVQTAPLHLLVWHQTGFWGVIGLEDEMANNQALKEGGRLLSVYEVKGRKFWVITEADRSITTILLPEEY